MKSFLQRAILGAVFALCPMGLLYATQPPYLNQDIPPQIMHAILQLASKNIPSRGVHCAIPHDGQIAKNKRKQGMQLGDFVAAYLQWSIAQPPSAIQYFACEGSVIRQCTWSFGENKPSEAWSRTLRFDYNVKSQQINSDSLMCVDVP